MKIVPVAINHVLVHLDNGEILDINDGTSTKEGTFNVRLEEPTERRITAVTSITYDSTIRIKMYGL